jgi:hypothetical protein
LKRKKNVRGIEASIKRSNVINKINTEERKIKNKFVSTHATKAQEQKGIKLHSFLTSAVDEVCL